MTKLQNYIKCSLLGISLLGFLPVAADTSKTDAYFNMTKSVDVYSDVLKELEMNYVDSIDYAKIAKIGLDNMLYSLDPYTVYVPSEEYDRIKRLRSGEYGGIGAVIMTRDGKHYISDPYQNMPAQKNDVLAGDEIIEIDGKPVKGMKVSQVSDHLRGVPGTEIRLKLIRNNRKKITRKFKRELIQMPTISYYGVLENQIGIICVSDFVDRTSNLFSKVLKELVEKDHIKGLIVDLRNNGGGLVSESVKIASLFLPQNTELVKLKGRDAKPLNSYSTKSAPLYPNLPLAFLVNNNTASSSEILSGSMQDLDRAVIIGKRTFGKGLVQGMRQLSHNGYLKVTTAKYYIPSGRCVQALDYSHRNEDGSVEEIPDSMTHEFKTSNGRIVRDGCGIKPDVVMEKEQELNITYYLYTKYMFFDFSLEYLRTHPEIDRPETFKLSKEEYMDFCDFVKSKKFTYKMQSLKAIKELEDIIKTDGRTKETKELLTQLSAQLQPQIDKDLELHKAEILEYLEKEIIKRYYYHVGVMNYSIHHDLQVDKAVEIINNSKEYDKILNIVE